MKMNASSSSIINGDDEEDLLEDDEIIDDVDAHPLSPASPITKKRGVKKSSRHQPAKPRSLSSGLTAMTGSTSGTASAPRRRLKKQNSDHSLDGKASHTSSIVSSSHKPKSERKVHHHHHNYHRTPKSKSRAASVADGRHWGNASSPAISMKDLMGSEIAATNVGMSLSSHNRTSLDRNSDHSLEPDKPKSCTNNLFSPQDKIAKIRARQGLRRNQRTSVKDSLSHFLVNTPLTDDEELDDEDASLRDEHVVFVEGEDEDLTEVAEDESIVSDAEGELDLVEKGPPSNNDDDDDRSTKSGHSRRRRSTGTRNRRSSTAKKDEGGSSTHSRKQRTSRPVRVPSKAKEEEAEEGQRSRRGDRRTGGESRRGHREGSVDASTRASRRSGSVDASTRASRRSGSVDASTRASRREGSVDASTRRREGSVDASTRASRREGSVDPATRLRKMGAKSQSMRVKAKPAATGDDSNSDGKPRKPRSSRRMKGDDDDDNKSVGSKKSLGRRRRHRSEVGKQKWKSPLDVQVAVPPPSSSSTATGPQIPRPPKQKSTGDKNDNGKKGLSAPSEHISTSYNPSFDTNDSYDSDASSQYSGGQQDGAVLLQFDPTNADNVMRINQNDAKNKTSDTYKHLDGTETELEITKLQGLPTFEAKRNNFDDSNRSNFSTELGGDGSGNNSRPSSLKNMRGDDIEDSPKRPHSSQGLGLNKNNHPKPPISPKNANQNGGTADKGPKRGIRMTKSGTGRGGKVGATRSFFQRVRKDLSSETGGVNNNNTNNNNANNNNNQNNDGENMEENMEEVGHKSFFGFATKRQPKEEPGMLHQALDDDDGSDND